MNSKVPTRIGILGGSGVYELDGLTNRRWEKISGPFGEPSDELLFGQIDNTELIFLPRHGRDHRHSPTTINYRANIEALKQAGVTDLISISAVGSLEKKLSPGTFVIIDDFIDRTYAREKSFFGEGCVAHVSMAQPVCSRLGDQLEAAAKTLSIKVARGGTYLAMEGPQFSSLAESNLYRSLGLSVIGMTNMPEAKLAREAEICYATVAMVTDYDCWHSDHSNVEVTDILRLLTQNAEAARNMLKLAAPAIASNRPAICPYGCDRALEFAIMTKPNARDNEMVAKLNNIAGRVL